MKESWSTKIYTQKGITKEDIWEGKNVLNIGCGQYKIPGTIGMDIIKNSKADVIHNIEDTPWPFSANEFDVVMANHVLEHIEDIPKALNEIHRVIKPGGSVILQVPYFRSTDAFSDITHRNFFTSESLDYVISNTKLSGYNYTEQRFKKIGFWYGWPTASHNPLVNIFKHFIHRFPRLYDQYISLLFPMKCLTWELEVTKS